MQNIGCVTGVVVRVTGVVVGLNHLQPGAQRGLRAVQELTHPKPGEDLQAQVGQRSVGRIQYDDVALENAFGKQTKKRLIIV